MRNRMPATCSQPSFVEPAKAVHASIAVRRIRIAYGQTRYIFVQPLPASTGTAERSQQRHQKWAAKEYAKGPRKKLGNEKGRERILAASSSYSLLSRSFIPSFIHACVCERINHTIMSHTGISRAPIGWLKFVICVEVARKRKYEIGPPRSMVFRRQGIEQSGIQDN
jgi:hypothetical protein